MNLLMNERGEKITDYIGVCLTGISTGFGVIFSKEIWDYFKKYRERIKKEAERMFQRDES